MAPSECPFGTQCAFHRNGAVCMSQIRLFAGLDLEARRELLSHATQTTYQRGDIIVAEGDPIDSILIVRSGRIKTFRVDPSGEETVLDILHDGQAIWHGMFLEDNVYHYSVGCLSRVEVCRIHSKSFEKLIAQRPEVAMGLIRMVCTELDDAEEKVMMLGIREPRRRLAGFLLLRDHRCLGGEISLKLEDIAASVGLRPETVSRNLASLEREGVVKRLGRGRLKVMDPEALREISGGSADAPQYEV
ncbi:MAG: Crp/Fnr family transcriptional regulator [Olsenella sp.]|nr:Crp/Fnr family transcriptional regulator [Olsenella sp.]